ncbi:MAG: thioredoxin [Patescibacteria group bacterium]
METNLTAANFAAETSTGVVLVDFWAAWCGPCQMMNPVVAGIAKDFAGRAKVGKVNIDEEGALAQKFGVMSIPTFKIFKDGVEIATMVGGMAKEKLTAELEKALA